jgi:hypothetical protein
MTEIKMMLDRIEQELGRVMPRLNELTEESAKRKLTHVERDEWARLHLRKNELAATMRYIRTDEH